MFYAELTKDTPRFRAFQTERDAAQWIVDQLGEGYAKDFWVDQHGYFRRSLKMYDFTAVIHTKLSWAIRWQADLDPLAARIMLRAIADAIVAE